MNLRDNDFKVGMIMGLLVPVLGYGLLTLFFTTLTKMELMDPSGFSESWRMRTLALLAICANLIPFNLYKKWRHNDSMRGMVIPTTLFVVAWVIYFKDSLFAS